MQRLQFEHGNLKASNCFLGMDSSGNVQIYVSDPHLKLMFSEPRDDALAIADLIQTFICGQK